MQRRTLLRGAGAIGVTSLVGLGAYSMASTASTVSITTNDTTLSNDDGEVRQVLIDPEIQVSWSDLDDAVGAVSIFIEARRSDQAEVGPNGDGYRPVARAQPPLYPNTIDNVETSQPGTTGYYRMQAPPSQVGNEMRRTAGDDWSTAASNGGIIVADAGGPADYSGAEDGYLDGSNVWSGTIPESDDIVNAEYGAVSGTVPFEQYEDGSTKTTTVDVRYTIQLLELNLEHFTHITGYNPKEETDGTVESVRQELRDLYDPASETWDGEVLSNTGWLSDVMPKDITVVSYNPGDLVLERDESDAPIKMKNQSLPVMFGPEGRGNGESAEWPLPESGPLSDNPTGRHNFAAQDYLEDNSGYPGFMVYEGSFDVTVTNEETVKQDDLGGSGSTNANAR